MGRTNPSLVQQIKFNTFFLKKELTVVVVLTFSAEILRVNDDLSRVLEYYRKIFGLAPGVSARTEQTLPPTTQTADVHEVSTGPASTLIDLGVGGQTADSAETPASSVLENELKALGKYCSIYLFNHGCRVKRREA